MLRRSILDMHVPHPQTQESLAFTDRVHALSSCQIVAKYSRTLVRNAACLSCTMEQLSMTVKQYAVKQQSEGT